MEKMTERKEEKEYSTKNGLEYGRKKTLYIVNFTPIRLLIFSASAVLLILFIFVLGFHLGSSKPGNGIANNNVIDNSSDILMRTSDDTINAVDLNTNNILSVSENSQSFQSIENNNSSIIRESSTSEDRYNEYTQSLALELESINQNIKEKDSANLQPNSTYNPPRQFASANNSSINPSLTSETSIATRKPYTPSSSADSVYFIQVAVGYDRANTYSARDNLKTKFPKAFIKEEASSDGRTMYKLKVGRYETREDAQKALAEIKKIPAYRDSYIYTDKKIS